MNELLFISARQAGRQAQYCVKLIHHSTFTDTRSTELISQHCSASSSVLPHCQVSSALPPQCRVCCRISLCLSSLEKKGFSCALCRLLLLVSLCNWEISRETQQRAREREKREGGREGLRAGLITSAASQPALAQIACSFVKQCS